MLPCHQNWQQAFHFGDRDMNFRRQPYTEVVTLSLGLGANATVNDTCAISVMSRQLDVQSLFCPVSVPAATESSSVSEDHQTPLLECAGMEGPEDTPPSKRQFVELKPRQGEKQSFLRECHTTYLMDYNEATEQTLCMVCN